MSLKTFVSYWWCIMLIFSSEF